MEAIEFAIAAVFRHFFFGLRLALSWALLLLPLVALAWFAAFRNGVPDFKALPPAAMAGLALLGGGGAARLLLDCRQLAPPPAAGRDAAPPPVGQARWRDVALRAGRSC